MKTELKPNVFFLGGLWLGSGNLLLVSAGEGEEPLKPRGFQHLGLVTSEWLGEPEKQNKTPGFCQNWWHQPHGNLESRVEIELDGDQDSQRSRQLYLELKIFPWHSTAQFLPPTPISVHTRRQQISRVVEINSFTIRNLRCLHVTKIKMYSHCHKTHLSFFFLSLSSIS